jgi:hypothetical protein
MVYEQYSDHLKLCQYLGKEPQGEFKEYYDFLTELWMDMEFTVINDHNNQDNGHAIILHKGKDRYIIQDFTNEWLLCQWDRVWSFFKNKKSMKVPEIKDFIQSMVVEHLKCKAPIPFGSIGFNL